MTVKEAKDRIEKIEDLCTRTARLDEELELSEFSEYETKFLIDVVAYLGDYKRLLEREIDIAELRIH